MIITVKMPCGKEFPNINTERTKHLNRIHMHKSQCIRCKAICDESFDRRWAAILSEDKQAKLVELTSQ